MNLFEPYIALFSETWKAQYKALLAKEHLEDLEKILTDLKTEA